MNMIEARLKVIRGQRKQIARSFADDVRWNNTHLFNRTMGAPGIANAERALIDRTYQAGCRRLSMGVH